MHQSSIKMYLVVAVDMLHPYQSFHRLLHIHNPSSGAGTVVQTEDSVSLHPLSQKLIIEYGTSQLQRLGNCCIIYAFLYVQLSLDHDGYIPASLFLVTCSHVVRYNAVIEWELLRECFCLCTYTAVYVLLPCMQYAWFFTNGIMYDVSISCSYANIHSYFVNVEYFKVLNTKYPFCLQSYFGIWKTRNYTKHKHHSGWPE
jgi:hypothetical protein